MTKNLNEKRKDIMDKIHNLSKKNFSLKIQSILALKLLTILINYIFYVILIRKNSAKNNWVTTTFSIVLLSLFLFLDLFLRITDLFKTFAIFSYVGLAQDVIDDYRTIERMQKEICDLEIEIKTKKESLMSL